MMIMIALYMYIVVINRQTNMRCDSKYVTTYLIRSIEIMSSDGFVIT